MLKLVDICKTYKTGGQNVEALKGVNLEFRKNEFVSVLGPSGCGKTTLLNIVGGLDKYTSGDLIINGKSTKDFKDKDWDTYRNHSVGFIFQSYNLIPHQTVLENVELALTLSGVSKKERRKRAIEVLNKVGLSDKIKNKPNQLSGGQMQRVAIARALVNNPEIILADEPTGALDSETSVQVLELLKEIAKDRLVIMVTHNPDLANKYSSRIVKLFDGELVDDSNPYKFEKQGEEVNAEATNKKEVKAKSKKKRMSFFTALSLSFKNLLTKKGRTILVSVAGSIGIIGIALILAISSGFNTYVDNLQKNTLSSYPVQITNSNYDISSLMQMFLSGSNEETNNDESKVHVKDELTEMLSKFNSSSGQNDLKSFKEYIENEGSEELKNYVSVIQYVYNVNVNAYYNSTENGLVSANLTPVFADIIEAYPLSHPEISASQDKMMRYGLLNYMFGSSSTFYKNEFWSEMIDNQDILKEQYELIGEGSAWAKEYNEIMIVVDKNNEISDYTLYGLGLLDQGDLHVLLDNYINNRNSEKLIKTFEFEDLLNLEYKIILDCDYFEKQADNTYLDIRTIRKTNPELYKQKLENLYNTKGITIKVAGIIREKDDAEAHSINTCIGYNSKLTNHIINAILESDIVKSQINNNTINVITNTEFNSAMPVETQKLNVLKALGYADTTSPEGIYLYPVNFEAKEKIEEFITAYNQGLIEKGEDSKVITYSDTIGTMMSSISTIISSISYVLIAFVAVSLVVSSIMIGVITYISVLERTKEIGVLRSIGASKRDVKRVFTAESFIIGLASGVLGIALALLFTIPINLILQSYTGLSGLAQLPVLGAFILIAISVLLTFIAGLIPSRFAAKQDPVKSLRAN